MPLRMLLPKDSNDLKVLKVPKVSKVFKVPFSRLPLVNAQINLALLSLIRIFAKLNAKSINIIKP